MKSTVNSATPKPRRIFWAGVSLALGLAGGVFLHYLIYRLSLPTEPFIYVSF